MSHRRCSRIWRSCFVLTAPTGWRWREYQRSQRARRISVRKRARHRYQREQQQLAAQQAAQERQEQSAVLLSEHVSEHVNGHDVCTSAASASGVHRSPPVALGLLSGGGAAMATRMTTRTQVRG